MKKLSKIYKELGIDFTFPIIIKDANGKVTYFENSYGYRYKCEYDARGYATYYENCKGSWLKCERDANGNETYFERSDGTKRGTPRSAKTCEGKVVEVEGIKYKLIAL